MSIVLLSRVHGAVAPPPVNPWTFLADLPTDSTTLPAGYSYENGNSSNITVSDGTLRVNFLPTLPLGAAPNGIAYIPATPRRCFQVIRRTKLSSNWYGEVTGVLKQDNYFFAVESAGNKALSLIRGAGDETLYHQFIVQGIIDSGTVVVGAKNGSGGSWNYTQTAVPCARDTFYTLTSEVYANTAGNADGEIRCYTDDTLVIHVTGVQFTTDGELINEVKYSPVYGGNGSQPPAEQQQFLGDGLADNGMTVSYQN